MNPLSELILTSDGAHPTRPEEDDCNDEQPPKHMDIKDAPRIIAMYLFVFITPPFGDVHIRIDFLPGHVTLDGLAQKNLHQKRTERKYIIVADNIGMIG